MLGTTLALASPQEGRIASGLGGIETLGATTTITQSSPQLSLTWQSFNIGTNEVVNFVQPSAAAIAVNRIADPNGTQILGRVNANGQVFLLNPNGILFGQGAQINVAGIVASTLDLDDASLSSNIRLFRGDGSGRVINHGSIAATEGGYVALLGNHVGNQGSISAPAGMVALGAGSAITLTFSGHSLVQMQVDRGVLNSLAENGNVIQADGGMVLMSAGAKHELLASVVNNTGVIQARRVENRGGTIVLLGGMQTGTVNVGGTLDASAVGSGDGGFVETSAANVKIASGARITTTSPSGRAGTWLIDPVDFTIAATGGDITGATLSTNLAAGNVTIQSSTGSAGTLGNVNVNDVVAWSASLLTLNAQKDINLNANLNASGTAGLALEFGQGAVAAGNTSEVITNGGAAVNLPASTTNFTTKLGSDGSVKTYTVITSLGGAGSVTGTDLQGMNGNLAANYALGANIAAAGTSAWNSGAGFAPIGNNTTRYTGTFDGLGHAVSGLFINRTGSEPIALFGVTATSAVVRNVGMIGGSVTSDAWGAGSLVGLNSGTVSNSYATGTVLGYHATGGLVGTSDGIIKNSYATGTSTSYGIGEAGGLVGWNATPGSIIASYATGNVSSPAGNVGGLTGINFGSIASSYATGSATGTSNVGGLAGNNTGPITGSYSRGAVTGTASYTGGLAGLNSGPITNSYSASVVRGSTNVGGLIGRNTGAIQRSYASGTVFGANRLGGLVGANTAAISNSYSTATVTSSPANQDLFGGLVGENSGNLTNTYASGAMSVFLNNAGGLTGLNSGGTITNSYWNTQTTGRATSSGGLGRTTAQMRQEANFTSWDFTTTWRIYEGTSFPLLQALMTPLTVTANNQTKTYTGVGHSGGNGVTYSALINGVAPVGTLTYGGTAQGKTTVGNYSITPGGLQSNQLYLITFADGALTINQAHLTVTAANASRFYGEANPTFTTTLSGFVNGETAATAAGFSGSATATNGASATTNAGTSAITASAGTLTATNYDFTNVVNGTLTINKAHLTITADNATRLYGEANPIFTTTLSGFVNGETFATAAGLTGSATATTTASATTTVGAATITAGSGTLGATNYDFTNLTNGTLTIGKAHLTLTADNATRLYGEANPTFTTTLSGFANGETAATAAGLTGSANATTAATVTTNVGTATITASAGTLAATNYDVTQSVDGTLTINKAHLTVTAANASRLYGETNPALTTTLSGFMNGETAATVAGLSGSASATNTSTVTTNVGTTAIMASAGTLAATNYDFTNLVDGTLTINQAHLTITAANATRLYGEANPTFTATLSGFVNGETASTAAGLVGGANATTTATPTTNVGTATITAGAGTLAATNYDFTQLIDGTLTINKAQLTVTANNATRLYGQANPTFTTTLSGFVNGETVSTAAGLTGSASATTSASPATPVGASTIIAGAGTLAATNYAFTQLVDGTLSINPAHLTVTAANATRVYGEANPAFTTTLSGFMNGETAATAAGFSGSASATTNASPTTNAGAATITASAGTLAATNYDFTPLVDGTLAITRAPLTATANAATKIYDGQNYSGGNGVTYFGFVNNETSAVLTGALAYAGSSQGAKNAGGFLITPQGLSSGNYDLIFNSGTLTINRAALSAAASVTSKTYDGDTSATIMVNSLNGLVGTETLNATASGTFATRNAGNNLTVDAVYTLADGTGLASNYTLANSSLTGSITPKALTLSGSVAADKIYDGTVNATVTLGALSGLVAGETLGTTATGTFADKNVGTNKAVGLALILKDGLGLASNYTASNNNLFASITPRSLAVSGVTANAKVYDATVSATLAGNPTVAVFAGDSVSVTGAARGVFADKNVGTNKAVAVTGYTLSGTDAGNYLLQQPGNVAASITPASLVISGISATDKIYDGSVLAGLSGTAAVSALPGDVVSVTGQGRGEFATPTGGLDKPVSVQGFTLSGTDAGNYAAVQPLNLTADIITPLSLFAFNPLAQFKAGGLSASASARADALDLSPFFSLDGEAVADESEADSAAPSPSLLSGLRLKLQIVEGGVKLPANRVDLQD